MTNRLRGTGRAVVETLREWIAGLGFFGALIAGVSIFAENVQGTLPGVAGLVLAAGGVGCGAVGFRDEGGRGRLFASGALALAVTVFVMLALMPR